MYGNIPTKVLTGEVRCSYVHLNEPYLNNNNSNGKPKYQVTLLIPKTDTVTKADIDASMRAAYEDGVKNKWKGARPQLKNALIYDGDGNKTDGTPFGDECKGHWVITASCSQDRKPQVVGIDNINVQLDPTDIYSGMYARVTINFFAYDTSGSKGVGCGLGNVMKTRDGEPLSGGASAASDFAGVGQTVANDFAGAVPQGGYNPAQPQSYNQPTTLQPQSYNQPIAQPQYAQASVQSTMPYPQIDPITGQPINNGTPW